MSSRLFFVLLCASLFLPRPAWRAASCTEASLAKVEEAPPRDFARRNFRRWRPDKRSGQVFPMGIGQELILSIPATAAEQLRKVNYSSSAVRVFFCVGKRGARFAAFPLTAGRSAGRTSLTASRKSATRRALPRTYSIRPPAGGGCRRNFTGEPRRCLSA